MQLYNVLTYDWDSPTEMTCLVLLSTPQRRRQMKHWKSQENQILAGHALVGYASSCRKGIDSDEWFEGLARRLNDFVGWEQYHYNGKWIERREAEA